MKDYVRHHCKCEDGLWRIGFKEKGCYYFEGIRGKFPLNFVIKTVEFPKD